MADVKEPVISPEYTHASVTDKVSSVVLTSYTRPGLLVGIFFSFLLLNVLMLSLGVLFAKGIGVWGNNDTVGWGFDITNFVWWVGIAHAGTAISAVLLLMRQKWRTSINRFAEAMTIFSVSAAGIFPAVHVGRPWKVYWLFPYPNSMALWPQFRSALLWDVSAVTTYATVSALFWYVGMLPDLATLRDRAQSRFGQIAYGLAAMGWRGSATHWKHYEAASRLLAGLATAVVVSVCGIVSLDFAVSVIPGWRDTFFMPYFLFGALDCGFAMVILLALPLRKFYKLEGLITDLHIDNLAKLLLASGLFVTYIYLIEAFMGWYNGDAYERGMLFQRAFGVYFYPYWAMMLFNCVIPMALWSRRVRRSFWPLMAICLGVNMGMWLERFTIIVGSIHRDYLPSSWTIFTPTRWDMGTYIGSIGLFIFMFLLFIRFLPTVSMSESRELITEEKHHS